ncbi:MAG: transketolase family protein [Oligoflexales bacterium]|nr:transketolase family protein [Oligoflexales bacterium]
MNLSDMNMNQAYATILAGLIEKNRNVMCIEADLAKATGTLQVIKEKFPENFLDVGVAEANMISVSAGLASEGKIPFCASFSCFATRRVYDQITISVAYAGNNVKIVGTAPGITQGPNGGTHMCLQDLAIMRAMPGMHVYSPCDPIELKSVMEHMVKNPQPAYMQLIRLKVPTLTDSSYNFDPRSARTLRSGSDVTIVSTGFTTQFALRAAEHLEKEGVNAEVLHYPSVKPFDSDTLIKSARKTSAVVTVENQNIIGGLGGAVCETLSENCPVKVKRLGVPDKFGEVATLDYLFEKHEFGLSHIVTAAKHLALKK